jgi:hypothetical protein
VPSRRSGGQRTEEQEEQVSWKRSAKSLCTEPVAVEEPKIMLHEPKPAPRLVEPRPD